MMDKQGWAAIFHAIKEGQIEKLKILLESGAETNLSGKDGMTPLMLARNCPDPNKGE